MTYHLSLGWVLLSHSAMKTSCSKLTRPQQFKRKRTTTKVGKGENYDVAVIPP